MCVVSSGLASRSVDFPLLWPLVGGIVECVHCLGPCLVLSGLDWSCQPKLPECANAKDTMALPYGSARAGTYPQGPLFAPPSLLPPPSRLHTLCYSLCALSIHHHHPPHIHHSPPILNPPSPHGLETRQDSQMYVYPSSFLHTEGEASSRSFKRTPTSPFQHCPLSSPIHLVFNLLLLLRNYHSAFRLRPTPSAPGHTVTCWTHTLAEQPTHTRTPFLSSRSPTPIKSIRNNGMNKSGIGKLYGTLTRQVLFKRKPVQYLPKPSIQDENTEVSWMIMPFCAPVP
jgi:hypothetical protein